jgi:hypothetical protein
VAGGSVSKLLTLETADRSQIGLCRPDLEAIKMGASSRVLLLSPATADRSQIGLNRSELEDVVASRRRWSRADQSQRDENWLLPNRTAAQYQPQ